MARKRSILVHNLTNIRQSLSFKVLSIVGIIVIVSLFFLSLTINKSITNKLIMMTNEGNLEVVQILGKEVS
jgi:hypothetical protein